MADTANGSGGAHLNGVHSETSLPGDGDQVQVYRNGMRIGSVVPRGSHFEAITAQHGSMGRFNTAFAAARALLLQSGPMA